MILASAHRVAGGDAMKKTLRRAVLPVMLLAALTLRADTARQAAQAAVRQSALLVFPSLFPFIAASRLLTGGGALRLRRGDGLSLRWFGVPAAGLGAVLLGLCGGYPVGVFAACGIYEAGELTKTQTEKLLRFCNNTGPAIFFGMVGGALFPDRRVCAALFLIHVLSAVLTGFLVSAGERGRAAQSPKVPPEAEPFSRSLQSAVFSALTLCGYVVFFSVLLRLVLEFPPVDRLLSQAPVDRRIAEAILCALTDLPTGIAAMAKVAGPAARFVLCAGAIGWGGLCVHVQAAGIWREAGLSPKGYYSAKGLQAAISCALALPAAGLLFGAALPVWPAALAICAPVIKKAVEKPPRMRYNKKNEGRRAYAVPKKDRALLRLLRQGGKGG